MSNPPLARNYRLNGFNLQVLCSEVLAEVLDDRFRLLPSSGPRHGETIFFDFRAIHHGEGHFVERPLQQGRAFYELASGQASYFPSTDQLYLSYEDGLRALGKLSESCASFSIVESEPANLFMASHLMLTILLVEFFKRHRLYCMHAAGFSKDGKAILIPGTSGAGKSTLAISLLRSGFGYLSDDMVFLGRRSSELRVLGFPEDVDVSDQTIRFFPELDFLGRIAKPVGSPKRHVRPDEIYHAPIVGDARPGAIVFPRISASEKSSLRSINADEALFELVSNVLLTEKTSSQNHLNMLTELARQTPCYRLEAGRDFDRIPTLLSELLRGVQEVMHA